MKYYVEVNGRVHEVVVTELPAGEGQLAVQVDGQPLDLTYTEVDALGQVAMLVDGKSYGVSIEGDANDCAVTVAGHLYEVELEDERERAAHAAERARGPGGGTVLSVMPGVVVDLLVTEGERVQAGQPLLILEAMKMQNEIEAPADAVVQRIHVREGQAVASGEKLVSLEAAD